MNKLKEKIEERINKQQEIKENRLTWLTENWNNENFKSFLGDFNVDFAKGEIIDDGRNELIKINKFSKNNLMVKKFNLTRTYDKLRFCILDSKAVRSLRIALALDEIDVKTPKPIAIVEERGKFNKILYSYYITEYIDFDYNLLNIVADDDHSRRKQVKDLLPAIARDVRKMHDAGIVHNDLHAGNILVKDIDRQPEFYYIDLNRGRIKENLSIKQRINDLARFKLTKKEQEIFMEEYAPKRWDKLLELMIKQRKKRKKFLHFKRSIRGKIKSLFK